ncbi:MAG: hypothetical protein AAFV53_36105, partial [Myxococcota bacterium]
MVSTFVRVIGNTFLVLCALDGLLTILVGWVSSGLLTGAQGALSFLVVLLSCVVTAIMVFSDRLPLSAFGPPIVVVAWITLGAMPLPLWVGLKTLMILSGGLQILATAASVARIGQLDGAPLLKAGGIVEHAQPLRPIWMIARFFGVVFGTPMLIAAYAVGSATYAVSYATKGFVSLGGQGVYVAHRAYQKDDAQIHLIGMIHIGDEDAYPRLLEGIPEENAVVLAEGVGDKDGLLTGEDGSGYSYGKVAERLNLSEQGAIASLTGIPVQNADLDVSAFSEETLHIIQQIGQVLDAEDWPAFLAAFQEYSTSVGDDPETLERLMDDILTLRNGHLIEAIDDALETHRVLVLPWGAYHLPEIEQAVLDRGFTETHEDNVLLIRYASLTRAAKAAD